MRFESNRCAKGGFTLIEVLAVILLIGVLTAVAVVKLSNTHSDLISTRDRLMQTIGYVRSRALSSTNTWVFSYGSSNSITRNGVVQQLPDDGIGGAPSGITISSGSVSFDTWGSPGSSDITITLTDSSGETKSIKIYAETGYVE